MSSHPLAAKPCASTFVAILLLCVLSNAQSTGSIEGQVTDQNGAYIVAAEVRASYRDKRS
jgi:hypothetical protein